MTEPPTREIQLNGKQLIFVFMSALLVAVVVFLLGVWVGRGIDRAAASGPAAAGAGVVGDPVVAAKGVTAPKGGTDASKLNYPNVLQGNPPAAPQTVQAPPPAPKPDPSKPPTSPPSTAPKPDASKPPPPATTPGKPAAGAPGARSSPPPAATGGWVVQTGAFSSKANADGQVARLKGQNYTAFVISSPGGPQFKVRVGPFASEAEARQAAARLSKEPGVIKPSVINTR